jgi:hypothetical protein
LIIGAGITGLTTALLLQESGKKCIIAEAYNIGYGTTGGTTAHLNTFLDSPYHIIDKNFGAEGAELVAKACKEAIDTVTYFVERYQIDCDFAYRKGYVYAETDEESSELDKMTEAAIKAGVALNRESTIPVSIPFKQAITFEQQAQIHPLKYIYKLAEEFKKLGGIILQNTKIDSVEKSQDHHHAKAEKLEIKARKIVYATHIPPGINQLHFKCAPYRSYVLGVKLGDTNYPTDLVYDMQDPYHYVRTQEINNETYLIVGGDDHKTGHGNPEDSFNSLENYVRENYNVASIDFKWSSQYFEPADGLPYIGKLPGFDQDIFVATGLGGNGITLGSVAGKILRDLILDNTNIFADLFSPSRIKPIAGFAEFVKENTDVVYRFIKDRFAAKDIESLSEIPLDSGAVIEFENEKLAIYRDPSGEIHAVSPVCTHTGCIVNWNNAEKSWDCPCHGARYDTNGEVITGPASKALKKMEIN